MHQITLKIIKLNNIFTYHRITDTECKCMNLYELQIHHNYYYAVIEYYDIGTIYIAIYISVTQLYKTNQLLITIQLLLFC